MSQNGIAERKLTELLPARRNRYYYGKLMDVLHFSMEQQYVLSKEWLYNRAILGPGVVCGLWVEPISNSSGNGVIVHSGLAIDGWGREIIVPNDISLVPLELTDQCGAPQPSTGQPLPSQVMIQVCYNECSTDFSPALANDPDCGCGGDCEAGTVVESYCIRVLAGSGPAVTIPCLDSVKQGLAAGDIHAVLCELSKSSATDPDDPGLTLANVTVATGGGLTVDDCSPRQIAATNLTLTQLVSCLAVCCASTRPLQVTSVTVLSTGSLQPNDQSLTPLPGGILTPPSNGIHVSAASKPNLIEITFGSPPTLDQTSVVLTTNRAKPMSVWIQPIGKGDQIITMPGNVFRIYRPQGFQGLNEVALAGGPEGTGASPNAIQATDGSRLDGEFPQAGGAGWHSGEGTPGGNFNFLLKVN